MSTLANAVSHHYTYQQQGLGGGGGLNSNNTGDLQLYPQGDTQGGPTGPQGGFTVGIHSGDTQCGSTVGTHSVDPQGGIHRGDTQCGLTGLQGEFTVGIDPQGDPQGACAKG